MKKKLLTVWSSPKKEEMYLYTDRLEGLKRVPEELLKMFGALKTISSSAKLCMDFICCYRYNQTYGANNSRIGLMKFYLLTLAYGPIKKFTFLHQVIWVFFSS